VIPSIIMALHILVELLRASRWPTGKDLETKTNIATDTHFGFDEKREHFWLIWTNSNGKCFCAHPKHVSQCQKNFDLNKNTITRDHAYKLCMKNSSMCLLALNCNHSLSKWAWCDIGAKRFYSCKMQWHCYQNAMHVMV